MTWSPPVVGPLPNNKAQTQGDRILLSAPLGD